MSVCYLRSNILSLVLLVKDSLPACRGDFVGSRQGTKENSFSSAPISGSSRAAG